jgi:hypothetical protein
MMNNGVLLFIYPCSLSNARNGRNARFLVRFAAVTAIMLDTECACPAGDPFIVIRGWGRKGFCLPDRHFEQPVGCSLL